MKKRDKELRIRNEYLPTPVEVQIIDMLLDHTILEKTVQERCELHGISRKIYYDHMKKPEFAELCRSLVYDQIKHNAIPMINVAVKQALAGSFPHLKLLMDMGKFTDDNKLTIEGTIEHIVTFGDPDDELPERTIIDITEDPEDPL